MEILAEKPEVLESSNPIELTSFSKNIEYEKVGFGYLKNELVLEISDISSSSYISALITYIDVILRLSQKPKTITIIIDV